MDISKIVVYDDRVVPVEPSYAIWKGASAITASQNRSISATNSQHLFTVNPPSMKTYIDRNITWSSDVYLKITVAAGPLQVVSSITRGIQFYNMDETLHYQATHYNKCAAMFP